MAQQPHTAQWYHPARSYTADGKYTEEETLDFFGRSATAINDAAKRAIVAIADAVAWRFFPDALVLNQPYPIVSADGSLVPMALSEGHAGASIANSASGEYLSPISSVRDVDRYAGSIRHSKDLMAANLHAVTEGLIARATGIKTLVIKTDPKTGEQLGEEVYTDPPDIRAAEAILNRIAGKPIEYKEVNSKSEETRTVHLFLPEQGSIPQPINVSIPQSDTDAIDAEFTPTHSLQAPHEPHTLFQLDRAETEFEQELEPVQKYRTPPPPRSYAHLYVEPDRVPDERTNGNTSGGE